MSAVARRVLVTGASGFVGRRVLEPLVARGFEVHAVARRVPAGAGAMHGGCADAHGGGAEADGGGAEADGGGAEAHLGGAEARTGGSADVPRGGGEVAWHAANLLDPSARRALVEEVGASHLLHLAWYAEPGAFWAARENAAWVAATVGLVDEFAAAGGVRATLAGTCAEYDWTGALQPLREDAPLAPATYYGACKDATRRVVEGLAALAGVSLAWGRIFFLYGPQEDERRLVASVARALARGERAPTSAGLQRRDFLHVDDVAGAFAAVLDSELEGPVNVASGEAVTVRSVAERLALAVGRSDLLDIGALPERPGDPPEIAADITRLRDEVGFAPAYTLSDGLAATMAWWRGRWSSTDARAPRG